MRARSVTAVALAIGAMLVARGFACAFPWSIDMYRGPQISPLTVAPRDMPPGTVPVGGSEPRITLEQAAALHNPIAPTAQALEHGKMLYDTDCAACHGASGRGDGPVAHLLRTAPPDMTVPPSAARADGYIYTVIRYGVGKMPALGDAMAPYERWEVVHYVRSLQQRPAAPQARRSSSDSGPR